ncbi:MAG: hypothetical protein J7K62_03180 [Thermoplasmata archaeon]|nr:hypothetical protein [Thermoplasmata archaeon]
MSKMILNIILAILLAYLLTNIISLPLLILHEWGHAIIGSIFGCKVEYISYEFGIRFMFKYIPFYTYSGKTYLVGCKPNFFVMFAGFGFSLIIVFLISMIKKPFSYLAFPTFMLCFMSASVDFIEIGFPSFIFNQYVMLFLYILSYIPFVEGISKY